VETRGKIRKRRKKRKEKKKVDAEEKLKYSIAESIM
jgi:hypothetical protein